ncbi:MAG: hypothetical protein GXP55_20740 [Deltaproteobacteria bacterium]|nr:hypothetical protein [Deltaproteobacteria bacterium]
MPSKGALSLLFSLALGCGSAGAGSVRAVTPGSGAMQTVTPGDGESCEQMPCDADHAGATCAADQQTCVCGVVSSCTGVDMGDDGRPPRYAWRCGYNEGVVRDDGCPGRMPAQGSACDDSTRRCSYGHCCIETMACEDGTWSSTGPAECPP